MAAHPVVFSWLSNISEKLLWIYFLIPFLSIGPLIHLCFIISPLMCPPLWPEVLWPRHTCHLLTSRWSAWIFRPGEDRALSWSHEVSFVCAGWFVPCKNSEIIQTCDSGSWSSLALSCIPTCITVEVEAETHSWRVGISICREVSTKRQRVHFSNGDFHVLNFNCMSSSLFQCCGFKLHFDLLEVIS